MDPERYGVEREAIRLLAEGEGGEALAVLRTEAVPSRLREVELLLQAGYEPVFDDVGQVIHWLAP